MTLVLFEALLVSLRHLPTLSFAPGLREIARELYMLDRNMIQFEDNAATWDPKLGYTLRPGEFQFQNTEFKTSYSVNQLGVRDDEQSLSQPQVVVIGDSFAMGWGVEQTEAFPSVLEEISGLQVLNTAIASFGTARQLRLLESVDTTRATHLVIQFCNNDYFENLAFDREGPDFTTQSEAGYDEAVARYSKGQRYFPGRYAVSLFTERFGLTRSESPAGNTPDPMDPAAQKTQAELFLGVLLNSRVDLSGMKIIVFELNAYNRFRGAFTSALTDALTEDHFPEPIQNLLVVDLASELRQDDLFQLDDHITAAGHRFLAGRILELITEIDAIASSDRDTRATVPGVRGSRPLKSQ